MKVAIIGAGVSGLSCAIELERHGIRPVIFEKTKMLGDKPGNLVAALRIFYKNIASPTTYFEKRYGIKITPLHPIDEMIMYSPNSTFKSRGSHGFIFQKGIEENSLEHQLASYIQSLVEFDKDIKIQDVRYEFDYVVVAAGTGIIPGALGLWKNSFMAKIRHAKVSGSFEKNKLIFYLDKRCGKSGYGYLLVKNENEAELSLAVSDASFDKMDFYWNEFLINMNIGVKILKCHNFEHVSGYPSVNRFENILFAGNSGGMMDDFLGFGLLRSIESGILAARAIAENLDYDRLLLPYKKNLIRLYEYRKMLDVMKNEDLDLLLKMLSIPGLKHFIYNNPLYKAEYGIFFPKIITHFKKQGYPFSLHLRK